MRLLILRHGAGEARAVQGDDGRVAVLAGSAVAANETPSCPAAYVARRAELRAQGVIKGGRFTVAQVFRSLSTAAGVVTGRSINGATAWRS